MSTIYTQTRLPYDPVSIWPTWITIPNEGEPFIGQSATMFEKAIADMNQIILGSLIKFTSSDFITRCQCLDGLNLTIFPYVVQTYSGGFVYFSQLTSTFTINETYLLPAGTFATDTWYYVYLNTTAMGFEINTTPPDPFILYQSDGMGGQDLSKKYICSFITDGAAKITPFIKVGESVQYVNERVLLNLASSMTKQIVSVNSYLPPHAKYLNSVVRVLLLGGAIGVASLYGSHNIAVEIALFSKAGWRNTPYIWSVNNDTPGSQTVAYIINTPDTNLSATIIGYLE